MKPYQLPKPPTQRIFDEMKYAAMFIWVQNYSDNFGWVTDKLNRISRITENVGDNAMTFFRMFDILNQERMYSILTQEAKAYIDQNRD